jgi:hypothetical protein
LQKIPFSAKCRNFLPRNPFLISFQVVEISRSRCTGRRLCQGCQIFLDTIYQSVGKLPKYH